MVFQTKEIENSIYHCFQPIYDIQTHNRIGFEGLLRSNFQPNPEKMFSQAKKLGELLELDLLSLHTALDTAFLSEQPILGKIFLNIFPSTIVHPKLQLLLKKINSMDFLSKKQIVLEVSENELIRDYDTLKAQISKMKRLGFLLAVDDFGKGYSNIETIIELEPDYIKLDRYFSRDIIHSKQKQSIIKLLLHYSRLHNCHIILEGVETLEELQFAKELGIQYAQGYYLGKPAILQHFQET